MEEKNAAKQFFDRLERDNDLQIKVRQGLENIAKEARYEVTESELTEELRKRWGATLPGITYSEPPGY